MRAYYRRMSVDAALKAAVFAEVEVDSAEVGAGRGASHTPAKSYKLSCL
jgi:hypothetical protein